MPMYEYRCEGCGKDFEELVRRNTADTDVECPLCGEHKSKRLLSAFAIKGSGGGAQDCGPTGSS